jgi:hypothetical protein
VRSGRACTGARRCSTVARPPAPGGGRGAWRPAPAGTAPSMATETRPMPAASGTGARRPSTEALDLLSAAPPRMRRVTDGHRGPVGQKAPSSSGARARCSRVRSIPATAGPLRPHAGQSGLGLLHALVGGRSTDHADAVRPDRAPGDFASARQRDVPRPRPPPHIPQSEGSRPLSAGPLGSSPLGAGPMGLGGARRRGRLARRPRGTALRVRRWPTG